MKTSRSLSRLSFTGVALAALVTTAVAAGAGCSETFPKEIAIPDASAEGGALGLPTRPEAPTCKAPGPATPATSKVSFERLSPIEFKQPVLIVTQGTRMYVLEQGGTIRLLASDNQTTSLVADLSTRLVTGGEAGLLGMAFHPKFAENGFVYLYYTVPKVPADPSFAFQDVIARYQSRDGGLTLDPTTEKRLFVVDDPYSNHNGGTVAFGNDGLLYFGLGDGGGGGDPLLAGQDPNQFFGKMLRFDVDRGDPYAIPADNPFAAGGGKPEIYALGFRNPYRFSFDRPTGNLWVGDVGQSAREEIDFVERGKNYGWNIREGKTCYNAATCDTTGLVDPVVDHPRAEATSICGGVVYRGTKIPSLTGKYVYGDTLSGLFWSFDAAQGAQGTPTPAIVPERLNEGLAPRVQVTSFALDPAGEIVFTDYKTTSPSFLYRIVPPQPVSAVSDALSGTGCVDPADPKKPIAGLFPYDVIVPQWDDGLTATRYLSLPPNTQLEAKPGGALVLPPGAIAIRSLEQGGTPVETQLLARNADGTYAAYAYAWKAGATDATRVTADTTVTLPNGRTRIVVAASKCLGCHNEAAGVTLGLEAAQLDRSFTFPGGPSANVLGTLEGLAMLTAVVPRESFTRLSALDGYDAIDQRARSYLHGNCTGCHRGGDAASLDVRITTALRDTRTCNTPSPSALPAFAGKPRIAAGNAAGSLVPLTMRSADPAVHMPPGATVVHEAAAAVVESWINSLPGCP